MSRDEQQDDQQDEQQDDQQDGENEQQDGESEPEPQPGQMTPEEAQRLLDAIEEDPEDVERRRLPATGRRPGKSVVTMGRLPRRPLRRDPHWQCSCPRRDRHRASRFART